MWSAGQVRALQRGRNPLLVAFWAHICLDSLEEQKVETHSIEQSLTCSALHSTCSRRKMWSAGLNRVSKSEVPRSVRTNRRQ